MKIKSVKIEGFHNVINKTYDFENLNYVKGPNGAGKSTVLQAIQLALLGYIPGTDKNKTAIFRHAGNHTMAVTLNIDDNDTDVLIRRIWSGGSSIKSSLEVEPSVYNIEGIVADLELPVFNFNEFVDMTANKLKDWFIDFLPSTDVSVDWSTVLKGALEGKDIVLDDNTIRECVSDIQNFHLEGLDEIRKSNEYFKAIQSAKKAELQRLENTIQSLIYYDDFDGYAMSIDEVVAEIATCEDKRRAAIQLKSAKDSNARIEMQLKQYSNLADSIESDPRVEHLESSLAYIADTLTTYAHALETLQAALLDCQADMKSLERVANSDGKCPYTSEDCDKMVAEMLASKQALDAAKAKFDDLYKERNDVQDSVRRLSNDQIQFTSELKEIEGLYKSRENLLASLVEVDSDGDADVDKWQSKLDKLNDTLVKLKSNAQYQIMIDSLTADKFKIDSELAAYKEWISLTGVNGLQSNLSSPFVSLGEQMNEFIKLFFGENVTCEFDIQAKANSFSFGIDRSGKYIPYNLLSSGEKCLYTFALLLTLVKDAKCPLKLILVDDLVDHLDDVNADKLFKSLLKVKNIQMIVAGVKSLGLSKGNTGLPDKVHTIEVGE